MVTISEFITVLQGVKEAYGDIGVVMSRDPEGNGFSAYSDLGVGIYSDDGGWGGEWTDLETIEKDPEDYEFLNDGEKTVCLWPLY